MTDQSQQDQCATRRCVLLGAGVLGAAGVLTACSTAPVPYDYAKDSGDGSEVNSSAPATAAAAGDASASASSAGTVLGMASEIPVGGGKAFTAAKVVVTQPTKGQYKAFTAVCTHVGCICNAVANGTINCPCHGSTFKITDGSVVTGPATAPLAEEKITVTGGKILLM